MYLQVTITSRYYQGLIDSISPWYYSMQGWFLGERISDMFQHIHSVEISVLPTDLLNPYQRVIKLRINGFQILQCKLFTKHLFVEGHTEAIVNKLAMVESL